LSGISDTDKSKALYRRALGRIGLKDDDSAKKDLEQADQLVKDAGIQKAFRDLLGRKKARDAKARQAYSKMFG